MDTSLGENNMNNAPVVKMDDMISMEEACIMIAKSCMYVDKDGTVMYNQPADEMIGRTYMKLRTTTDYISIQQLKKVFNKVIPQISNEIAQIYQEMCR